MFRSFCSHLTTRPVRVVVTLIVFCSSLALNPTAPGHASEEPCREGWFQPFPGGPCVPEEMMLVTNQVAQIRIPLAHTLPTDPKEPWVLNIVVANVLEREDENSYTNRCSVNQEIRNASGEFLYGYNTQEQFTYNGRPINQGGRVLSADLVTDSPRTNDCCWYNYYTGYGNPNPAPPTWETGAWSRAEFDNWLVQRYAWLKHSYNMQGDGRCLTGWERFEGDQ